MDEGTLAHLWPAGQQITGRASHDEALQRPGNLTAIGYQGDGNDTRRALNAAVGLCTLKTHHHFPSSQPPFPNSVVQPLPQEPQKQGAIEHLRHNETLKPC